MAPRTIAHTILAFALAGPLSAAIGPVTLSDNRDGDYLTLVRNQGNVSTAINLGHDGPDIVLNGTSFVSTPGPNPSGPNWSVTGANTDDGLGHPGIDDIFFSEVFGGGENILTYTGLDPARTYLVQVLHGEPRDCCRGTFAGNTLATDVDPAVAVPAFTIGNELEGENPPAAADVAIITAEITGATTFTYVARAGDGRGNSIAGFQVRELAGPPPEPTGDTPFVSEFVAAGNETLEDEDGDTPDWIEIYNPTGADLDLAGYHLTDDPADPTKWTFPATLLQAGAYLVVFASDKDRDLAGAELHTNFKLASAGNFLALVEPGGSTIVSEYRPSYPVQESGFSFGVGGPAPDDPTGYFAPATPGSPNGTLLTAPLLAPVISPSCGTFTTSTEVELSTAFPGGQIRYTTNGSVPTANSTPYTGPLRLTATTHLRARVFDPAGGGAGEIAGGHYQRISTASSGGLPAPASFTSNLPIVVYENFGSGGIPSPGSAYQTGRLAIHEVDPATGRSSLSRPPDACLRVGIRRRGQSSSGFSKPQYRIELRDESDIDLDYPLLGLPEESDWVLNGPWTDKALIRNPLAFSLGREFGIQAPRFRHCEMFLSTNGGTLTAGEYVGVYVLLEKIKDGRNRTDIEELEPEDNAEPDVTGGYMLRFEPPGIANDGPRARNWTSVEIIEPDQPTATQQAWIGRYLDRFVATLGWGRGRGPNNTGRPNPDPDRGYPAYIDVDSFVSLFLINELLREQDSYVRSDYMHKDRLGKLHKGPLWDYNLTAGTGCCFDNRNTRGWQHLQNYNRGGRDHSYEPDWFVPLMRCPEFRQKVIDRWAELRHGEGILEVSNLFDLITELSTPLRRPAIRNFTRWDTLGNSNVGFPTPSTNTWTEQVSFMRDWLVQRMGWIDSQFPGLVSVAPASSVVDAGSTVTLASPGGTVYYTIDGSDPRAAGGEVGASALTPAPGGGITIDSSVDVITRSFDGTNWSAPTRATFVVGTPADAATLAVTELNYHPSNPTPEEVAADPTYRDDDFEFLELKNISSEPIDLAGIRLTEGISFAMPAPAVLAPGGYALLVENLAAFEERYGPGLPVLGVYADKMKNDGDTLRLVALDGSDIFHFTFNDTWYRPTDGQGYSLVATDEGSLPSSYGEPASWAISCDLLGSPGRADGPAQTMVYDGWLHGHFSAGELADPVVSGPLADPDRDGILNLLEYALALDPRAADRSGLPVGTIVSEGDQSFLALTFRQRSKALDLTYRVEGSEDLVNWAETGIPIGDPVDLGDGTVRITIRDTVPLEPGRPQRFLRLSASLP